MMCYDIKKISKNDRKLLNWLRQQKNLANKKGFAYRAKLLKEIVRDFEKYGYFNDNVLILARFDCRNKKWHDGLRILTDLECDIKKFLEEQAA